MRPLILPFTLLCFALACPDDASRACNADTDCFVGELCRDGICSPDTSSGEGEGEGEDCVPTLGGSFEGSQVIFDAASPAMIVATSADSSDRCMRLMTEHRIRHLPVVDGEDVVGVISIGDLVKAVIEDQRAELDSLQRYIAG